MNTVRTFTVIISAAICFLFSCKTIEKASIHGFHSGYYEWKSKGQESTKVYADIYEEKIDLYPVKDKQPEKNSFQTINLIPPDASLDNEMVFKKKSLDIDLTSVPLKFRPAIHGVPGQMSVDFNLALYAGWRHDFYQLGVHIDPIGKRNYTFRNRGFDWGIFAGPGTALISPFTTRNQRIEEYNALIVQAGMAAFLESDWASFGVAIGFDFLPNNDRNIWIYHQRPWIGFIIGVALN